MAANVRDEAQPVVEAVEVKPQVTEPDAAEKAQKKAILESYEKQMEQPQIVERVQDVYTPLLLSSTTSTFNVF